MARRKSQEPDKSVAASAAAAFNPDDLSKEQQAAVVEAYLGVHPDFFLYSGLNIRLNHGQFRAAGHHFNGWKPAHTKYNSFEG